MRTQARKPILVVALGAAMAVPGSGAVAAHEVPNDVTILAFVRPAGIRAEVLVRVPLEAIRDFEFPLRGPGYLVFDGLEPLLRDAARLWIADYIELREGGRASGPGEIIATRVSLPSDRSFVDWERARRHVTGAGLPDGTELIWQQAMLDVLLEYRIESDTSEFAIHLALAHLGLRTTTALRFLTPDGTERAFEYTGDPGLVRLDPRWHHAFLRFVRLGFLHILDGIDHLLFVLCLVIPFRRLRPLIAIVTAFTVAHSITLIASATGLAPDTLWFPPLIELLIALSIVWLAFENIVGPWLLRLPGARGNSGHPGTVWAAGSNREAAAAAHPIAAVADEPPVAGRSGAGNAGIRHRWLVAFVFGLVHGFGFSFVLRDSLQFAGSHVAGSLFAFNVGVELGQLLIVVAAIPLLSWLFRQVVAERAGVVLLSALIAHTAWHWMTERFGQVRQFEWGWPTLDTVFIAGLMRGLMLLLIVFAVVWLLRGLFDRLLAVKNEEGATTG